MTRTRGNVTKNTKGDDEWVDAPRVDKAVDVYIESIDQSSGTRSDYEDGFWCLDANRNQVKGCRCVFEMQNMKMGGNNENLSLLSHAHLCNEISGWYSTAKKTEEKFNRGEITRKSFCMAFHRTMTLKVHPQGSPTKMVDMLIKPSVDINDEEGEENYVPANSQLSIACFCLNSVIGIWKVLVQIKRDNMDKWKEKNYLAILYQGGRNHMDSITQKKRQKLFYSRMLDIVAAKPEQTAIRQDLAARCYQDSDELGEGADEVRKWKRNSSSNWKHWRLGNIRVLVANSSFNFSRETKLLVEKIGIRISSVSEDTLETLRNILGCLWRESKTQRKYWRRVTQDHSLFFCQLKNCHSLMSGLDLAFSKGGGYKKTGMLAQFLDPSNNKERKKLKTADDEIKSSILEMLNRDRTDGKQSTEVAYQPSFIMSSIHKPQQPHFDYRGEDWKRNRYWIGFLPITDYGQFLQLWDYKEDGGGMQKGEIVFIPKGHFVMVRGDTLHGGGFRAETTSGNLGAHGRVHFYIYPDVDRCQIDRHGNQYRDPNCTQRKKLVEKYINNDLLGGVINGGDWCETMNWTFFQGECPIDEDTGVELKMKVSRNTLGKRKKS